MNEQFPRTAFIGSVLCDRFWWRWRGVWASSATCEGPCWPLKDPVSPLGLRAWCSGNGALTSSTWPPSQRWSSPKRLACATPASPWQQTTIVGRNMKKRWVAGNGSKLFSIFVVSWLLTLGKKGCADVSCLVFCTKSFSQVRLLAESCFNAVLNQSKMEPICVSRWSLRSIYWNKKKRIKCFILLLYTIITFCALNI